MRAHSQTRSQNCSVSVRQVHAFPFGNAQAIDFFLCGADKVPKINPENMDRNGGHQLR